MLPVIRIAFETSPLAARLQLDGAIDAVRSLYNSAQMLR